MAISVGEVEATIKLRDEMSTKLAEVQAAFRTQMDGLKTRLAGVAEQHAANEAAVLKSKTAHESLAAAVGSLSTAFVTLVGVGGLGMAIKGALSYADRLDEMSAATGIGVEQLQRFGYAATLSGTSLETLQAKTAMMVSRVEQGTPKAVAAMNALRINFESFKELPLDQQILTISQAVNQTTLSSGELLNVFVELYGRGATNLIPFFKDLNDLMAEAPYASEESVRAAARLNDQWEGLILTGKTFLVEVLGPMATALKELSTPSNWDAVVRGWEIIGALSLPSGNVPFLPVLPPEAQFQKQRKTDIELLPETPFTPFVPPKKLTAGASSAARKLDTEWIRAAMKEVKGDIKGVDDAMQRAEERGKKMADPFYQSAMVIAHVMEICEDSALDFVKALDDAISKAPEMAHEFAKLQIDLGVGAPGTAGVTIKEGMGLGGFLKGGLTNLPGSILGAIMGGGSITGAIGGTLGTGIGDWAKTLTSGLSGTLGSIMGGIMPGIGTLLGAGIGKLVGWIGGLFKGGPTAEEKAADQKIGDLQAQLISTYGSLDKIRILGKQVGIALADAWGDRSIKGLQHFQKLMDQFQQRMDALQSSLDKYGLTWENLGQEFKQFKIGEMAEGLLADFNSLQQAGVDTSLIYERMAPAINEFFIAAMRNGLMIPLAFQPLLQTLIDMGLLLDANGQKIADLTGVAFTATTTAATAGGAGLAGEIANNLGRAPRGEGGMWERGLPPELAYGGALQHGGIVTRPTAAILGEGGPEAVIPLSAGAFGQQVINVNLDGQTIARVVARNMPRVLQIQGVG